MSLVQFHPPYYLAILSLHVVNKPLLITGDFSDREILTKVQEGSYDVVYHLAANPRVPYSVKKPVESNETNLHKSVALF